MQNPSRRAFFRGKTPEIGQWDQLILQLQRKTQGELRVLEVEQAEIEEQAKQVVFRASSLTDLHYARQLCHAFEASLYLWGCNIQIIDSIEPIVWLDMTALNQLMPIDQHKSQWFMQAGVSMGQLKEAGFDAVGSLPDDLTIANWLANPHYHSYALSELSQSGLEHASLMTADGSVNSLGSFGVQNTKPLNTKFLQQVVPQLFELATSETAQALLDQPNWLGRYRLDIFNSENKELNLAHLLLGHSGDLGILEWVVINKDRLKILPSMSFRSEPEETTLQIAAEELDAAVKSAFDPNGLFSTALIPYRNLSYAVPQHV